MSIASGKKTRSDARAATNRQTATGSESSSEAGTVVSAEWLRLLRRLLRGWYRRHARDLPWRRTRDPYAVWVSETMLQQTQVAAVIPYYERFLQRFPDIKSLAQAPEAAVLRLWEGLGYYRRARQLHRGAQVVLGEHGGRFPQDLEAVRAIPGIGRYTAGAIVSFAFDRPAPIVEANTLRVYCRLLAFRGDPRGAAGQRLLWETAEAWLPRRSPGEFNQALMELGSTVCKPRTPDCDACPLAMLCPTRALGLQEQIPLAPKRIEFEAVREAALVVRRRGRVLLVRRPEGERWAGLWDFPRFSLTARSDAAIRRQLQASLLATTGVEAAIGELLATLKHGVTRFRITLSCYAAEPTGAGRRDAGRGTGDGRAVEHAETRWAPIGELDQYALPVTGRKLARLIS